MARGQKPHYLDRNYLMRLILRRAVVDENGCWIWPGCRDKDGYGKIQVEGRSYKPHRISLWAFEQLDDLDNPNLVSRHQTQVCKSKACVNPIHLEVGTQWDNFMDSVNYGEEVIPARNYEKTSCDYGHPFDEENTVWAKKPNGTPFRRCKICMGIRSLERSRKNWNTLFGPK